MTRYENEIEARRLIRLWWWRQKVAIECAAWVSEQHEAEWS